MRHLLRISLAHFKQHRLRTVLTLVGIAAGVTAVVSTKILSDSIYDSFDNLVAVTAGDAELHVANAGGGVPEELLDELRAVKGVAAVSAIVEGFVPLGSDPGKLLAIFGMDVLADDSWRRHIPRSAITIPDELAFLAHDDSIVVTKDYAARENYEVGSHLDVVGPDGPRTLVVRGIVDHRGLADLFEARVAVMDLSASQKLLEKLRRFDRIDLYLDTAASLERVKVSVEQTLGGRGRVRDRATHGRRALDLLLTIRVMLGQAVVMSMIVAFLIIYHTMSVSIVQRYREIGLLRALGASRRMVLAWVGLESVVFGLSASTLGLVAATGLGRIAVYLFAPLTESWIRLSPLLPQISWRTALASIAIGTSTSLLATLWAGARVLWHPVQPDRNLAEIASTLNGRFGRALVVAGSAAVLLAAMVAFPPRLTSFPSIMSYTALALVLLYVTCGLASALPALWIGLAGVATAKPRRGVGLLFASATLSRSPAAPAAVVTAIVVAIAWTVGSAAYMASVRTTWLGWVDREYPPGKILVTSEEGITGIEVPVFASGILGEVSQVEGIADIEGMRQIEAEFANRPIVIQARDEPETGFHLADGEWSDVSERFRHGQGVLMDNNLARVTKTDVGDTVELVTNDGLRRFQVLALLDVDVEGGDLGSIILARHVYGKLWRDDSLNRMRVTIDQGADAESVAERINQRFTRSRGLYALTGTTYRKIFADLIDAAFAGTYALIFVGFTVSFIAIVNFLLAMLVERRIWYQRLYVLSASTRQIRATILAEGAVLGIVGSVVGVAAAVSAALFAVYRTIPMINGWLFEFTFPLWPMIVGVGGTIILAVAAAGVPARLATRSRYLLEGMEE